VNPNRGLSQPVCSRSVDFLKVSPNGHRCGLQSRLLLVEASVMRRRTKKRLYRWFVIGACLFSAWQLYELFKWKTELPSRHPGVPRPWER